MEGRWCCEARKVTVCLASHRPCVTDSVVHNHLRADGPKTGIRTLTYTPVVLCEHLSYRSLKFVSVLSFIVVCPVHVQNVSDSRWRHFYLISATKANLLFSGDLVVFPLLCDKPSRCIGDFLQLFVAERQTHQPEQIYNNLITCSKSSDGSCHYYCNHAMDRLYCNAILYVR